MKANQIFPLMWYWVRDPYGHERMKVKVLAVSNAVEDHWRCHQEDGKLVLIPRENFVRLVDRDE
jgi:hypothetical protein